MIGNSSFRKAWASMLLTLIAALTYTTVQAKPQKGGAAAMHYEVAFKGYYVAEYRVPNANRIIRAIPVTRNDMTGLGRSAFPLELRAGTEPLLVRVFVVVNLSENDALTDCRISSATRLADNSGTRFDATPAFEASVCTLLGSRLAFRHGLFDDGRRFGGPVNITLEYMRWSGSAQPKFSGPMLSVAPTPMWDPNELRVPALTFTEPEWEKFIPALRSMPKPLVVGVRVVVAKDGTIARCYSARHSTVPAFNSGVCDALRDQARTGPIDKDLWDYPMLMRWDGTSLKIVAPQPSQPVTLTDGPRIPSEDAASLHLPANARSEVGIIIAKDGKAGWCRILGGAQDDALDVKTCAMLMRPGFFRPGVDIFGEPSAWRLKLVVDWRTGEIEIREAY